MKQQVNMAEFRPVFVTDEKSVSISFIAAVNLFMTTVEDVIVAAFQMLNEYDIWIEREIPWAKFKESAGELDKYQNDVAESTFRIREIKQTILNAIDAHFYVSQNVYEWASLAASHLKLYVKLFDGHDAKKADTQKLLLIEILDNGVAQMTAAQAELDKLLASFNSTGETFTAIRNKHFHDAVTKHVYGLVWAENENTMNLLKNINEILSIYVSLDENVKLAVQHVVHAKEVLPKMIEHMNDMKTKAELTVQYVNLDGQWKSEMRDIIIEFARRFILKCEEYRRRRKIKV